MTGIELLRELQGERSQEQFASDLGVARSTIAMIYLGHRRPGRQFLEGLIQAFPTRREEILSVFLPSDGNIGDVTVASETETMR